MVRFAAGFVLTVRRYGPPDRFGHRPPPSTFTIAGCAAAPAGSIERTGDQVLTIDADTVYAPFDADVVPTDELVIPDGLPLQAGVYQVNGRPERWRSPFDGTEHGTVIRLSRAAG